MSPKGNNHATGGSLSRRDFLKVSSSGLLGSLLAAGGGSCGRPASPRPNFVFFLTDDQRWDGMSCAGNEILQTPHMDRISEGGMRFENMFVTTALCGPSRACFLTGNYSHKHDLRRNGLSLSLSHVTFPEILKRAGYETAFIGKWHNTDRGRKRGFDYYFGFSGQGRYYNPLIAENEGPDIEYPGHITDILADKAIAYLEKERSRPFCLLVWFKAPHRSFRPAERFKDLYKDIEIPKPVNFHDDYAGRPDAVKNANMRIGDFDDIPDYQTFVKDYYRCLAGVDENLGRILDAIEKQGLTEDTMVLYSGDNGFFIGEHHFFDKRFMYEESIRVPLLVRFPRMVPAGSSASEMALNVDVAPTILDVAGVDPPASGMDGKSLKPLLQGRKTEWRKDFLYEYYEYPGPHSGKKNRGVRSERWKYIHFFEEPQEYELYDLANDPHEMLNLINDPEYAGVVEHLRKRMLELRMELNDPDL